MLQNNIIECGEGINITQKLFERFETYAKTLDKFFVKEFLCQTIGMDTLAFMSANGKLGDSVRPIVPEKFKKAMQCKF